MGHKSYFSALCNTLVFKRSYFSGKKINFFLIGGCCQFLSSFLCLLVTSLGVMFSFLLNPFNKKKMNMQQIDWKFLRKINCSIYLRHNPYNMQYKALSEYSATAKKTCQGRESLPGAQIWQQEGSSTDTGLNTTKLSQDQSSNKM